MDNGLTTSGSVCSNVNLKSCNYKFNIVFVNVVATVSLVLISTRVLHYGVESRRTLKFYSVADEFVVQL